MDYADRIFPTNKGLTTYLEDLKNQKYQIPTFQRDVVWDQVNVKKLWDSIYKFYPLGSILIWKTDIKLQNHREIGGYVIFDEEKNRSDYQYILDGQQRTTSLLTSLYGGKIKNQPNFDPTIYVDLTIMLNDDTDDDSYRSRFLYWSEIDDRGGVIKQNTGRMRRYKDGLIIKLLAIKNNFTSVQNQIFNSSAVGKDFNHPILNELSQMKGVLDNYRVSFIELKGIQVSEVCQIFERINQAGKPLDIFDIVVAKTFKPETDNNSGFYLRDLIDDFREQNNSAFLDIGDLDYLQMLAVIINQHIPKSGVQNITDRYLNEIKTEHILAVWDDTKYAISKVFDFFENHLHIKTPSLIPYRYFYMTLASYFYRNGRPDYAFLKKYFWYYSFHIEDLLSNTTNLFQHIAFLNAEKQNQNYLFGRFLIDKQQLRSSTYSSRGRMSRAILSLFANAHPRDWEHCDREVLVENLFFALDKPNLHHIFPINSEYIKTQRHMNKITSDSLINIVYLTQITNLEISNRNPLEYIRDYDRPEFELIMDTHFLPKKIVEWARAGSMPFDALDIFIEDRLDKILDNLRIKLADIPFEVIDTREHTPPEI